MASSFFTFRGPVGGWKGARDRAKQLLAGAIEGTIANSSETKGSYRPAAIDTVGAIPAIVGALVNQRKDGKPFSGDTTLERWANNSLRRAQLASQRTNKTLGIHDPQNTAEMALRVAGGFAIPGPKSTTIAKAFSKAPKVVAVPAKIATELALPLRQTSIAHTAPIAAAMTGVLDTVMDQSVDPSTGVRYQGSVPKALGVGTDAPIEAASVDTPVNDELDDFVLQQAVDLGDISHEDVDKLMAEPLTQEETDAAKEDDKLSGYEKAAIALTTVLGGGAILKYGKDFLDRRSAAAVAEENIGQFPEFTGKRYKKSNISAKDKLVTNVFQQERPIISAADEFLGRAQAQKYQYKADALTNSSIGAKFRHFVRTGRMPGTNMRADKLGAYAEAYAKELSLDEQTKVSDALLAASALDDFRNTGNLSSLTRDKFGNSVTPDQLRMMVQDVQSNPKYAKYFNVVQKSFDDMLKYRVVRGLDTYDNYSKMRRERPNYVIFNRNLEPDVKPEIYSRTASANDDFGLEGTRTTVEGGGVSGVTGVGNPFSALFDDWAGEIRRAEVNDFRANFLQQMEATGARSPSGSKLVEKVNPRGPIASAEDGVHRVRINGKDEYYKVRDPEIARALHFQPRASIKGLEELKNFAQNLTTGAVGTLTNFFGLVSAPIFESMAASTLRGRKAGLLNNLFVGGHVGGLRSLWDDMRGHIGQTLRDNVIRENTWLKNTIGDANVDHLATYFENAFENSIKGEMDRLGISSIGATSYSDPSKLTAGLDNLTPHFAQANALQNLKDIQFALSNDEITKFHAALKGGQNAFAAAKAAPILRAYSHVLENMQAGAKYSAFAAARKNPARMQNVDQVVSEIRRLAADPSKYGANPRLQKFIGANMYGPIATQMLYEIGHTMHTEGVPKFLFRATGTAMTAMAMTYMAMATDPDALERYKNKTPQQKVARLPLWNGMELPVDPVQRLILGAVMPLYDQISGLNEGKFDPNFLHVMQRWMEGEAPELDDTTAKDFSARTQRGIEDNLPVSLANPWKLAHGQFDLSSFPLAGVTISGTGVDPSMSRMLGEATPIQEQDLTGFEQGKSKPGSMLPAQVENTLFSLLSSTGRNILGIADDAYRAYNSGAGGKETFATAVDSWKQKSYQSAGIARPLFGDREEIHSSADVNYQLLKDKQKGIDEIGAILNKDVRSQEGTGLNYPKEVPLPDVPTTPLPQVEGTELERIGNLTKSMNQRLAKHQDVLSMLGKELDQLNAQSRSSQTGIPLSQDKAKRINQVREEIKYQRMMMLVAVREYEEIISDETGRNFSYDDFDPKDYLNPVTHGVGWR